MQSDQEAKTLRLHNRTVFLGDAHLRHQGARYRVRKVEEITPVQSVQLDHPELELKRREVGKRHFKPIRFRSQRFIIRKQDNRIDRQAVLLEQTRKIAK